MARINTNVGAVVAQRHLTRSYVDLNRTINRLSSGLRIARGADDPAGLIASERLRAEIQAVQQASENTQRASLIIATAEGALDEVSRLLVEIQDLIVEAANEGALSEDEIRANQLALDSAIDSITRVANTTTFAGRHLINGSLDYVTSGVDDTLVDALHINATQFGTRTYVPVNVDVTVSAQPATLFFQAGSVATTVTIELAGNRGATTLTFASGTAASAIVAGINAVSDATGVLATLSASPTSGFVLESELLGSRQFVSVEVLPGGGTFNVVDENGTTTTRDEGRDAVGLINGTQAQADGNYLTLRTPTLDIELSLVDTFGTGTTAFAIIEGGALFQVGPEVNTSQQVNIGIRSMTASRLGTSQLGFLSQVQTGGQSSLINGEYDQAQQIVKEAIRQVTVLRGRLGAFELNALDTNVNQLGITLENLMAAESTIRDADFAHEISELTRDQILVNAGTAVLAIAQQTPQTVLRLLS